eukprot:13919629-Alexandrium_andersonii.AAC.1
MLKQLAIAKVQQLGAAEAGAAAALPWTQLVVVQPRQPGSLRLRPVAAVAAAGARARRAAHLRRGPAWPGTR